jgi:hypothetical protein
MYIARRDMSSMDEISGTEFERAGVDGTEEESVTDGPMEAETTTSDVADNRPVATRRFGIGYRHRPRGRATSIV